MERVTGIRPPLLDHPDLPKAAEGAWWLWLDIHEGRTHNGNGVAPLSWSDIKAWSDVRNQHLSYTELELVRTIDRAYVAKSAKDDKNGSG